MSQKVLTNLDLCKNSLLNLVIENLSAAPGNPVAGSVYFDTGKSSLLGYDGTKWTSYDPTRTYTFSKASEGVLKVQKNRIPGEVSESYNVTLVDTSKFDTKGSASSALSSAKSYTDEKIAGLVNSAPAELDTLKELADAVSENKELISTLQQLVSTGVKKSRVLCPALTASNGVCTWLCDHGLTLNSWKNDNTVLCDVYDISGEKVLCDIKINSATNVIIKFASTENISAGTYYAVFVG